MAEGRAKKGTPPQGVFCTFSNKLIKQLHIKCVWGLGEGLGAGGVDNLVMAGWSKTLEQISEMKLHYFPEHSK